jgi:hypothetical protein
MEGRGIMKEREGLGLIFKPDELWPPSVGTFPTCQNCIYSYEEGRQCRYNPTDPNDLDEDGDRYEFGNWRGVDGNMGDHCGQGAFVVGEPGNRSLLTFVEWYRLSVNTENSEWRKKNA